MGCDKLRRSLPHEALPERFLQIKGNYQKNGNKGSYNKTLWTTLSFCLYVEAEDFPAWTSGKPGLLDLDVRLYLGHRDQWKLLCDRRGAHGFPGAEPDPDRNEEERNRPGAFRGKFENRISCYYLDLY